MKMYRQGDVLLIQTDDDIPAGAARVRRTNGKMTGAELVSTDEYGKLWRKEQNGDEALTMVEVINSTPEPDGSTKTYYLRVPPDMRTPRQEIAWTFGIEQAKNYHPEIET